MRIWAKPQTPGSTRAVRPAGQPTLSPGPRGADVWRLASGVWRRRQCGESRPGAQILLRWKFWNDREGVGPR